MDRDDQERRTRTRSHLVGTISHAGFASGDRLVVGWWDDSPVGPLHDVMWATPAGERVLLADRPEAAEFIGSVYRFDRVVLGPVEGEAGDRSLDLRAPAAGLVLALRAGPGWRLPFARLRRPWVTRFVEGPIAGALLGVRTYGVSPTGVREWYRADEYRPLRSATATLAGRDLGPLVPFATPARFGFSEPPRRPAIVRVRPLLEFP